MKIFMRLGKIHGRPKPSEERAEEARSEKHWETKKDTIAQLEEKFYRRKQQSFPVMISIHIGKSLFLQSA